MNGLLNAGFCGFFFALAVVSVIGGVLLRSRASTVYAVLMLSMVSITLYSIPGGEFGGGALHALLIAVYLGCVMAFAFTLLQALRFDPIAARATIAIYALNVVLIYTEFLVPFWKAHLFFIDQLALDGFMAALIVLGFRALPREGKQIAGIYLAAFVGPVVGNIVDDLVTNVFRNVQWLDVSFSLGTIWEAVFFACAVALRNRGMQMERDRFERLAYVDGLTGVANRRTFDETLERTWNVARRAGVPVAIVMVDIDFFKRLNDTRGHQVGDECLRRVAALCSAVLRRAGDCFARYGGEEFAAILFDIDLDHATTLAETMRRTVERDGGITVSIGVAARAPYPDDTGTMLVTEADQALYRAKHEGRNCVRVATFERPVETPDSPPNVTPFVKKR